jgi:hypothetical protein
MTGHASARRTETKNIACSVLSGFVRERGRERGLPTTGMADSPLNRHFDSRKIDRFRQAARHTSTVSPRSRNAAGAGALFRKPSAWPWVVLIVHNATFGAQY